MWVPSPWLLSRPWRSYSRSRAMTGFEINHILVKRSISRTDNHRPETTLNRPVNHTVLGACRSNPG